MIVTRPDGQRIVLTDHAIARYRSRINRKATAAEIAEAVRSASFFTQAPSGIVPSLIQHDLRSPRRWLAGRNWAVVLRGPDPLVDDNADTFDFMAVTVVRRQRRSKAEIRAMREQAREDEGWAA